LYLRKCRQWFDFDLFAVNSDFELGSISLYRNARREGVAV
jgi:hypothetical protein